MMIKFKISKKEDNKFSKTFWHIREIDKTINNLIQRKSELSKERDDLWKEVARKRGIEGWDNVELDSRTRIITVTFKKGEGE